MAIEIRHLTIKSTIVDDQQGTRNHQQDDLDIDLIKEDLLAECRRLISENMRSSRDR